MAQIQEVNSPQLADLFIRFPKRLYKNDPEYIMPLDEDIRQVFDPAVNLSYSDGEAIRWILFEGDKPVGRVAAFYTHDKDRNRLGGMGFFECENRQEWAFQLFDTCKHWLQDRGVTYMDGPINFGDRDAFWGLMVSGFKHPSYKEPYNPPYYQAFFENYGFVKIIEQSTSEITKHDFNFERFSKLASRPLSNPAYEFRHMKLSQSDEFARDFVSIYNQAWAHHENFIPMTFEKIKARMAEMKPIVEETLNWFVYANGEPAGFYINVLDVNQIFKHVNGKLNLWGKLKFLWYKKHTNRVRGIVFGVIPKYQNLGLEIGMIMKFHDAIHKLNRIDTSELAWVGDFNPKMHSMLLSLGARATKMHYTYKYTFQA